MSCSRCGTSSPARNALPEDLHVLELGVGNGNQAKVWLDEFLRLDREHGRGYYRRLHYLMCDYSPHVLDLARENVAEHAAAASAPGAGRDPADVRRSGFLRGKTFLIYISNVYDNLPTDEVVRIGGHTYLVETRGLHAAGRRGRDRRPSIGAEPADAAGAGPALLQLGPALLRRRRARPRSRRGRRGQVLAGGLGRGPPRGALRPARRAGPLPASAPAVSGGAAAPALESAATSGCTSATAPRPASSTSLPLLHPFGKLQCHDMFVTGSRQYRTSFRGPGKYDGSVVNWVNGPLLAHVGRRKGFEVRLRTRSATGVARTS